MIDYISGHIAELSPTRVVIDNHGIGYSMEISLQTFAELEERRMRNCLFTIISRIIPM